MSAPRDRELELDSGGFGRLDISDISDVEGEHFTPSPDPCDWCKDDRSHSGDYLVVADNRHFLICPICWGRSATYVELRQTGVTHDAALERLTAP